MIGQPAHAVEIDRALLPMLLYYTPQYRQTGDPRRLIFLRPFLIETERRKGAVDSRFTEELFPIRRGM